MRQCLAWGSGAARARNVARLMNLYAFEGGGRCVYLNRRERGGELRTVGRPDSRGLPMMIKRLAYDQGRAGQPDEYVLAKAGTAMA